MPPGLSAPALKARFILIFDESGDAGRGPGLATRRVAEESPRRRALCNASESTGVFH